MHLAAYWIHTDTNTRIVLFFRLLFIPLWFGGRVLVYSREFFFLKYLPMFFFWLIYCISYHIQMGKKDSQQAFDASISSYKSMDMITIEVAPRHFYSIFLVIPIWKICHRKLFYENKIFPENWHVDSVLKTLFFPTYFSFLPKSIFLISTKSIVCFFPKETSKSIIKCAANDQCRWSVIVNIILFLRIKIEFQLIFAFEFPVDVL